MDANEGKGGSYVSKNGERELVQRTEDHPDGNAARDAQGRRLGMDGKPIVVDAALAPDADNPGGDLGA